MKTFCLTVMFVFILLCGYTGAIAQPVPSTSGSPPEQTAASVQENSSSKIEILTSISFNGNTKFTDEQLFDVIEMKVGDNLTKEMIGVSIGHIVDLYRSNGANLSISPNVTPGKGVATIEFMIDESGTKGDAGPYEPGGGSGGGSSLSGGSPTGASQPSGKGN